ncbi:hypothetical protein [Leifsonia sp. AG29]|uniref:hypothetical protein n=1 Tax=Leifsonia sp. AG29 TaxID=2598860 RepID=UPI00131C2DAE|nr:hypothetical protein [Leifsonia sp. AG29]
MGQKSVEDANRTYFQALATSRASLGQLPTLAILILALLGALSYFFNAPSAAQGHQVLWLVRDVNMILIGMSAVVLLISVFRRLLYRFQAMFSTVMAVAALGLVYSVCLLPLPLVTFVETQGEREYRSDIFVIFVIAASAILVGAIVVHALMLRHRLRVGHSEERTIGNFVAVSRSNRSKIVWITFGLVAVVPNVLTSGQYLANSLGAIGLIFFACVTPSLPVEFAYLAYLKSKDRAYWEARPPRLPKDERRRLARKTAMWVFGIAVALALFWVFAKNFSAGV